MDGEGPIEGRTRDDRDGDSSGAGHGEYRAFVMTAGGGVTVSGGESLLQPAFTAAVLRRCKECGLYTALDTSGFLGARAEDALIGDRPRAAGHQGLRRRRLPHADGGDLAPIRFRVLITLRSVERRNRRDLSTVAGAGHDSPTDRAALGGAGRTAPWNGPFGPCRPRRQG
jgi:hypothetical protein